MINNFRSFHKEYVQLSTCDGLKLFSGQNLVEPKLGANGCGKTSFWDAVYWCFYGTSVKGLRTSSLIQWTEKSAEVLVELMINKKQYFIYRSGPPVRIEINEEAATQVEIDKLIGLNADQFLHAIIFGQGVPLFPDLPIPERGALLDSVLNLDIWQKASEAAMVKVSSLEKKLNQEKFSLAKIEGQLEQLPTEESILLAIDFWEKDRQNEVKSVKESLKKWIDKNLAEIESVKQQAEAWKLQKLEELEKQAQQIDILERELANTEDLIKELPQIDTKEAQEQFKNSEILLSTFQKKYAELSTELRLITKPRDFWLKNNNCPTCLQSITDDTKQQHLAEIETEEQRLTDSMNALTNSIEDTKEIIEERKKAFTTLQQLKVENNVLEGQYRANIKRIQSEIKRIEVLTESALKEIESGNNPFKGQLLRLQNETNPYETQLKHLEKQENPHSKELTYNKQVRQALESNKVTINNVIEQVNSTIVSASYWKQGFKRIRLYFIQQILTALEIEIQSAISALGLDGWIVNLSTESETKSGTIKLGVQIHIKSPISEGAWEVWSGGESQRLRLAIAMGLSSLIQRAAGAWFSFETWDEPSAWLSSEGIEDLLQALQYRAESQKKSIWLVDHRALQFAGFKEIWIVSKEPTGSSIQLVEAS